jgi:hypothetical protein
VQEEEDPNHKQKCAGPAQRVRRHEALLEINIVDVAWRIEKKKVSKDERRMKIIQSSDKPAVRSSQPSSLHLKLSRTRSAHDCVALPPSAARSARGPRRSQDATIELELAKESGGLFLPCDCRGCGQMKGATAACSAKRRKTATAQTARRRVDGVFVNILKPNLKLRRIINL